MRNILAGLFSVVIVGFLLISLPAAKGQQKTRLPGEFVQWLPVSDAERILAAPSVDKTAGAEILFWRVHVVDELLGDRRELQRVLYHYIRLKVFDEKGKEKAASVDLPYREPGAILDVSGRTIKADGTILDLDRKSVFRRELVRASGLHEKAVSFAMPGVEKGSIVEYRWKQTEDDNRFRYLRLRFQRDVPVERVTYFVIPLSVQTSNEKMAIIAFNCTTSTPTLENDGYTSTTVLNVPAARDEPFAPGEWRVIPWALLFYRDHEVTESDKYWADEGRKAWREFKESLKSSAELKSATAEAIGGAKDDDEKVTRLVTAVRKAVRNFGDPEVTTADREKLIAKLPKERNRTSAEIFRSGIALPAEMNIVFGEMAAEAGIEVRPVLLPGRDEPIFVPKLMTDRYFLDHRALAIKRGDSWKIFDVDDKFLTPGMLSSSEEGVYALITDPKNPSFIETPPALPEASLESRTARLALSADGTLEGDVEESYSGHRAESYRAAFDRKSPTQREEWLRDRVVRMFPDGEVTAIKIDGATDPAEPLKAQYHLKAPLYAQVTGKRILLQPSAFRRAESSPFTSADRRYDIEFAYAWKEVDQIHIKLPVGFALDNADAPSSLNFGATGGYKVTISVSVQGKNAELVTSREFVLGNKGILFFPAASYATLKQGFGEIQKRDVHAISLLAIPAP